MPWINHPARQDGPASVLDWLRYHIAQWMFEVGRDLEHRALYPDDVRCPGCDAWLRRGETCDHIPF